MDFLNALGISVGAAILIPVIIITIKAIYWMCVFARLGDMKNNQYEIRNQINEQKKSNALLTEILHELIKSQTKEQEDKRNLNKIIEEIKLENEKLKATVNKNNELLNEIEQKMKTQKD